MAPILGVGESGCVSEVPTDRRSAIMIRLIFWKFY